MIQATASIHPQAVIGKNVTIEPFTIIDKNVIIENDTWIGPHVTIMSGARIGKNCQIFPGAVIATIPQDLKFQGETTTVEIGDNTIVREYVTINRGTVDKYKTVVKNNCLLMAYVHIAHDCLIGNHCIIANDVQIAGHVVIDDYATIGGTSAIHQFVKIGKYTFIAGGSFIRKNIPPYIKSGKEPMRYCGINVVGLQRHGFSNESIDTIQKIYRYIFQKGWPLTQALNYLEYDMTASNEKDEILSFIKKSNRGLIRGVGI